MTAPITKKPTTKKTTTKKTTTKKTTTKKTTRKPVAKKPAAKKIGYQWHLRRVMAERGMFATTELVPLLAERGIGLSREQVYRLVTGTPERLNLAVLVALCDILDCQMQDLIEPVGPTPPKTPRPDGPRAVRPRRAEVSRKPAS